MLDPSIAANTYNYSKELEDCQLRSGHFSPHYQSNAGITCHISHVMRHSTDLVWATYIGIHYRDYYVMAKYAPNEYQFLVPSKDDDLIDHVPEIDGKPAKCFSRTFRSSGNSEHVGLHKDLYYICHKWDKRSYVLWDKEEVRAYVEGTIIKLGVVKDVCKARAEAESKVEKKQAEDSKHDWKHDISINL